MNITKILTLAALVGTALMGGLFFAFSTTVMSSLQRMPAGQGATAMNIINVRIQNPLFLLVFLGTALACLVLAVLAFVQDTPGKWWLVVGAVLYIVGVIVISFAINIPLNDELAAVDPNSTAGAAEWLNYLAKWNPANNVRAIACALAVVAFGLGLHSGSSQQSMPAPASRSAQAYQGSSGPHESGAKFIRPVEL